MEFKKLEDYLPDYYKVIQLKLNTGETVTAWRASDGENEIYTIYNSDKIVENSTIEGWKELEIVVYNVLPTNDLKEHIENGSCFCSPKIEKQENGSILIIHNSLDGREEKE